MQLYDLEQVPGKSLYERLTECIRRDIINGTLAAGTRLPSKRRAAQALGISVVTVMGAYDQLLAEGYIVSKERQGYYVAMLEQRPCTGVPKGTATVSAADTPQGIPCLPRTPSAGNATPPFAEGETQASSPECNPVSPTMARNAPVSPASADGGEIMDLVQNSVPPDLFPLSVWNRLLRRVLAEAGGDLLRRVPYNGLPALRQAIADSLYESRGITATPDQILVSAGNEMLYSTLLTFFGRQQVYGVEDPGYRLIARLYAEYGATVRFLPLDGQGVRPDGLETSGTTVLHISPAHHFPTGIITPAGRRQELLTWLEASPSRYIIEDDYDSEFRMSGRPIPSLQRLDTTGRVVYINTFTKTVAPSLRIAYAVLPPRLSALYRARFGWLSCPVAVPEQYVLTAFMADGFFSRHVNRMRTHCRALRDSLLQALERAEEAHRYTVSMTDGGLHFLLKVDTSQSDAALCSACAREGVRILSLGHYFAAPPAKDTHTLVVSYAGLSMDQTVEFVRRLDRAVEKEGGCGV